MSALARLNRTKLVALSREAAAVATCLQQQRQPAAAFSSKDSDSFYKVVKSKIRLDDETDVNSSEGGPNWELFAPRGNRFFLPGSLGPAWQGTSTTATCDGNLENLIDFEEDDPSKMHISTKQCPVLMRGNLHELFPAPEVYNKGPLTMVTLTCRPAADDGQQAESGAKAFVLAAREMCARLRMHGYWADFMNPFSGRPFHSYASGKKLYKVDARFRGLGIRFEEHDACLVITPADGIDATNTTTTATPVGDAQVPSPFSGNVFTTAPVSLTMLQALVVD